MTEVVSSKAKGDIGEQIIILRALKRGWAVLVPIGDRLPYDLVIDTGKSLLKVQVRSGFPRNGKWEIPVRKIYVGMKGPVASTYQSGDFDILIGCDLESEICYVIPNSEWSKRTTSITVRPSSPFNEAWSAILD